MRYDSKDLIDEATPWVLEDAPIITSSITKLSLADILKIPVLAFQLSTSPVTLLIDPVTVSPLTKSLDFNLTSNNGKYFCDCQKKERFP